MGTRNTKAYETPPAYYRARWELHHFNIDAAASEANALVRPCPIDGLGHASFDGAFCQFCEHVAGRYYTEETDGLNPDHYQPGDRVWCNPPYDSSLIKWVKLARELQDIGVMWELLLPASTSAQWFRKYIWNDTGGHWRDGIEANFIGRIQFLLNGQPILDKHGKVSSSRQDNLRVVMAPEAK